jgi:ATP-dependent HslUV protease ATP-binding subunit HslU
MYRFMHAQYNSLTPLEIVKELDNYIVGQADAKKNVAIALRNRWRRMHAPLDIRNDIVPNNILMIGDTGVGKTEIARRLAKIVQAPFVKVEASKFTEVGYVGRDVESMVRDLVEQAVSMVKAIKKEEVKEKASRVVEDIILDSIFPDFSQSKMDHGIMTLNAVDTRESYRQKFRAGELDDRDIDIKIQKNIAPNVGIFGGNPINEAAMVGFNDMLNSIIPQKSRKKRVTVREARKILLEEESSKLLDMDDVNDMALAMASNTGIIFIDEIDKIASSGSRKGGADISREGVQRDLLPIIEGSSVTTKYGVVHTDHILFIAAGAFHLSKPSDLIPELQGRLPIRVELSKLTENDFIRILKEPKSSLIAQYKALFKAENVELSFDEEAISEIAHVAFIANEEVENIGARRLHTVLSYLLKDYLYDVPNNIKANETISISVELVKSKLSNFTKSRDFSEYII